MYREVQIRISPEAALSQEEIKKAVSRQSGISNERIVRFNVVKRSVDARRKPVLINLCVGVHVDEIEEKEAAFLPSYRDVSSKEKVIIVGAGPAGLFAALRLIERGFCPVVFERGKTVDERKTDLKKMYVSGIVDPDSNFGFGEGGAGTFSDGKLFSRSKKRGNTQRILEILVYHGADKSILVDAHPHIGTDKLGNVIINIRKTIERYGGVVHFGHRVTDLLVKDGRVEGVIAGDKEFLSRNVVLATGHSARDIYNLLHNKGITLEQKEFAVGLRLEHLQHDIDCIQYHSRQGRGDYLPAAEYNFVANVDGRGVYTFCMCPGGVVVPAATAPEQQVVNGMSSSTRNSIWANSAIVTTIGSPELEKLNLHGIFGGMKFQEMLEKSAYSCSGGNLFAPAQAVVDFLKGKTSQRLPITSYKPGVVETNFSEWLPDFLYNRLKTGIRMFDFKAKGFVNENAILLGVETRTSSPVRIPRSAVTRMNTQLKGLFPCGEGAGYAGGIMSAAMDGESCAEIIF
ncbi:MAG: FAD-dependent oxidoreductase [Culturomica sp.]|jgi:uncharacterized FAD-dependent dehydrogenase|nr:FAD-dependent oxidoreductase [Culturomica sp.]